MARFAASSSFLLNLEQAVFSIYRTELECQLSTLPLVKAVATTSIYNMYNAREGEGKLSGGSYITWTSLKGHIRVDVSW